MRIAVSGKGGVGKTTLSAMLAATMALEGRGVIALDADPDANLASALGIDDEHITPLSEMEDLIAERTGSKDNYGGYFQLNPKVDDIPEDFAERIGPIRLLTLGGVSQGGGGCICPASALVKALLTHVVLGRDEAVIMDMEAGLEHLGRATTESMDALVVVVTGSAWSARTAMRVRKLAADIGIKKLLAVANLTGPSADTDQIAAQLGDIPLIGRLPFDPALANGMLQVGPDGKISPSAGLERHKPAVEKILTALANTA